MAEGHYSDSEPILPHEELADELDEVACDLDDDVLIHTNSDPDERNFSQGCCSELDDSEKNGNDQKNITADDKSVIELLSHAQKEDAASQHSIVEEKGSWSSTSDENSIQVENEIVDKPLVAQPSESSFGCAIPSDGRDLFKPITVDPRTSNISEASSVPASFAYDNGKARALSIPLHTTILCPPAPEASAIFYDGELDDDDGRGAPVNGHVVDGTYRSPTPAFSSVGSSNELRNFAVSVDSDSTNRRTSMDLDAAEKAIQWDLNYQEAAIYLEEGANNDKFDTHPRDQSSLPAYQMVHNRVFYCVEFIVAMLLMCLAFLEKPSVFEEQISQYIHGILEIIFLLIISMESIMKMRWMGIKVFVRHKRSMFKGVLLVIVLIEALAVSCRSPSHPRITRALRPIFLMDCRYARGVRRFVRHILLSLPPVIEMCILLLFFNFIFAILGNSLFSETDEFFPNLWKSFVSLFVLFSSANYPDVMMRDYSKNSISFLFFLVYLLITLYIIMNLLLAVVINCFSDNEMKKLKGLLLHRRSACRMAFKLLNSRSNPDHVSVKHFAGLMRYFAPSKKTRNVYLCFKTLNKSETGLLSLDEFMNVYEVSELKWKEHKEDSGPWFNHVDFIPLRRCGETVNKLVKLKAFKYLIFVVLFGNAVAKAVLSKRKNMLTNVENGFLVFYIMEALLKIFGLGPKRYFKSAWNSFDFSITILASFMFIVQQTQVAEAPWFDTIIKVVNVLRPLRLLRLFKYRKRHRDVFATVFVLLPRMASVGTVLLLLYYFFAIIGMEIFYPEAEKKNLVDCCNGTDVADSYTNGSGFYYLNNFDNILRSMVTLFELTVVNNWFVIMDGFAIVMKCEWTRLFFMSFYLMTMVVMNIVIAFILEAFTFRIDYRKSTEKDMDEDAMVKVSMSLTGEELRMVKAAEDAYEDWEKAVKAAKSIKSHERPPPPLAEALHGSFIANQKMRTIDNGFTSSSGFDSASTPIQINTDDSVMNGVNFRATRSRRKVDFSIKMYADQVDRWIKESDEQKLQEGEGTPLLTTSQWSKNSPKAQSEEVT